jgi:hypothetical protein
MSAADRRRDGSLSNGMVILASVRARLLGMQLLKVDADVTVSPTSPRLSARRPPQPARPRTSESALPGRQNGSIGNGLGAAARSLEQTTRQLESARRSMP